MLPAIYQSNFHPTAFFIGKNKRKMYSILIRLLHSLGLDGGIAGFYCQTVIHALTSRQNWLCKLDLMETLPGRQSSLHETSPNRSQER